MLKFYRRLISSNPNIAVSTLSQMHGKNEPVYEYRKGSKERRDLEDTLARVSKECPEVPICIGKLRLMTNEKKEQKMPHDFGKRIARYCYATKSNINQAINEAVEAQEEWRRVKLEDKHKIFYKAAELMSGKYRQELNAATMLGQSKTAFQAEIDTVELIDFLRFGADYMLELAKFTPLNPDPKTYTNSYHLRPLEGFIAAVTPFNFTAIAGNLAFTPTLLGNCSIWKPSDTAILSNWLVYKIMIEAGLPQSVVSFVPAKPDEFGDTVTMNANFAGLNFTGSVATFRKLWTMVGNNIKKYNCFPRMVGECGGKNYHFVHPTADLNTVLATTVRAAFEYSGQKCSACSRIYIPESMWDKFRDQLKKLIDDLKIGDVSDFSVFTSAVIDERAYDRIATYISSVSRNSDLELIAGGSHTKTKGYFVTPTVIRTKDPFVSFMKDEIFGPVLSVYVYKDSDVFPTLTLVKQSTQYALTGSIFAKDNKFIRDAEECLRMSAGNFYINDKCTGSVVGQQPFGGARLSGTNDKAGSPQYLLRWASPQIVKETFVPLNGIKYPYME